MDILNQMFQEQELQHCQKKNQSKFENLLLILQGRNPESCSIYGICNRQLTVEADGSVYPCDFYAVDEWKLGKYCSGYYRVSEKKEQELHFVDQSRLLPDKCKNADGILFAGMAAGETVSR